MVATEDERTILVVEDDAAIADLLGWVLGDAGYRVHSASTVAAAMELVETSRPAVVVADLMLPDGSGSEVVERVKADSGRDVAAIVMSAHPEAREHARRAGADACLPKPFDLDDLYATIDGLLSRSDHDCRPSPELS